MRFLAALVFLALMPAASLAQSPPAPNFYTIKSIDSGDAITLADGTVLRLEGIAEPLAQAPDWRDRARQALQELAGNRTLMLENISTDRYGRKAAQAYTLGDKGDKIWLQGEMLKRGLAFVYPPTGGEARLDEMRALEAAARKARTGIWSDQAYADLPAGKMPWEEGRFAFASGIVLDAKRAKEMVYIHFGENWRSSLTISIAAHDLRAFRETGIDPLDLAGKTIRVRGWIKHDIGPMIEVTDPNQIELLR